MMSRKNVFSCSAYLTDSPLPGLAADRISDPCRASAKAFVKKNAIASMCAGL